jgi:RNase P/RNase MRP subunit p29
VKATLNDIVRQEFVGITTHIVKSSDSSLACRTGIIVDESRETFRLATLGKEITVPKRICVFSSNSRTARK